jgi:hypothetical protein
MNKESEGIWEEMVINYFKVLDVVTNSKKILFRIAIPGLDLNQPPPNSKSYYCDASQLGDFVQWAGNSSKSFF